MEIVPRGPVAIGCPSIGHHRAPLGNFPRLAGPTLCRNGFPCADLKRGILVPALGHFRPSRTPGRFPPMNSTPARSSAARIASR
jgi:hypothetical protein